MSSSFCFRFGLVAVTALLTGSARLLGDEPDVIRPDIVSPGALPFSETWDQMLARDAEWAAAGKLPSHETLPRITFRKDTPTVGPQADPGAPGFGGGDLPEGGPPESPQGIGTNFNGLSVSQAGFVYPPDSDGAVGPSHYLEMINGGVGIYNKTGTLLSLVSLSSFFSFNAGGVFYPRNGTSDPHVIFDRILNRWFACTLEFGPISGGNYNNNHILLAVCRTNNPQTGMWDKYAIPVGVANVFNDFDTVGLDANGVYFGMRAFAGGGSTAKLAATPLAPLIAASPSLGAVSQFSGITNLFSSPQPAHNQDAAPAGGRAWFVSSSTSTNANIAYRTLTWSGGAPTLTSTLTLTTPAYGTPLNAPANGSSVNIDVGDDRLFAAVIRNGDLWTARNIGTNASGGSTSITRTGCEWLQVNATNATASLVQSGRIYDTAATTPRYYYYPSIMVSGQGHMALGCNGSRSTEFVAVYAAGRLATDASGATGLPTNFQVGLSAYNHVFGTRNRWGDYSTTTLDPNDDMSIWTVQEYAGASNTWVTRIARLLAPPPTLDDPLAAGCAGLTGLVIPLTGTNFFDPGAGFANHLSVSFSGTGVTVTNTAYNDPNSVSITVDVAPGAASGGRNIILTNPDGQTATVVNGFVVGSDLTVTASNNGPICTGGTLTLSGAPGGADSYSWSGPNGFASNVQNPTVSNNATPNMAGTYTLTVTSGTCSGMGSTDVTIGTPPMIVQQPVDQTVCPGTLASFSVTTSGSPAFQWQVSTDGGANFSDISGANSATYSFTAQAAQSGNLYHVVVSEACGSVTSSAALLTSTDSVLPTISVCAADQTVAGTGNPCLAAVPSFTGPPLSASDNCGSVNLAQSPTAGTLVGPGDISITITATDGAGNTSMCTATLHVTACAGAINIASASPPNGLRDTLQNTTPSLVPQGIGVAGTPNEGSVTDYGLPVVTFSAPPSPLPTPGNTTVSCTGGACPTVTGISGSGAGPYAITLSGPIPVLECITLTFAGAAAGQKLQYSFLPGDANLDGSANTQDLLTIITALNDGTANLPANLARYDINRSGSTNTSDLLRLVQLLNGTSATQAFNGSTVALCP
ncbi:MAG TPA: dockerin type I domain-containing protein [Phycisphaerae bacterium]|jgi:hypothetical protein